MDCYSFYEKYQQNDNEWWKLSEGEMQNLYDDAMGLLFRWEKTTNEQIARAEAAEAEVARLREALELAEAEVERLLSELSDAVDGHWDAEPSWYADKALTASPYADGAYDNTTE